MNKFILRALSGICGLISLVAHADTLSLSPTIYTNQETAIGLTVQYQADESLLWWGAGIRTLSEEHDDANPVLDLSLSRAFNITDSIAFVMSGGVSDFNPFVEYASSLALTPTSAVMLGGRTTFFDSHNKNELLMSFKKAL
ncbi:hypothetical protein [Aeromonas sp.]|uniref:hypothetical protein n=1 Tax=Aeromonas sp. TaxID=647 RepID=UPI0025900E44|nr:hypothetical protein [Aeromonas sp.]MCX7127738.1 hypothetical protein [Aeromonas sp.]